MVSGGEGRGRNVSIRGSSGDERGGRGGGGRGGGM